MIVYHMNLLKKKVSKANLFVEYTKIINGVLTLSNRECEVFSFLLEKDSQGYSANINSNEIRKELIQKFNISAANLSRYLGVLKTDGLIIKGPKGKWVINDLLRPVIVDNKFELRFLLEIE